MDKNIIDISSLEEWKSLLAGEKPVVVDFWAPWCGPCRAVAPLFEEAAKQLKGSVVFCKVDIDQVQELASLYGVMSIPTFILLDPQGKEKKRHVGGMTLDALLDWTEAAPVLNA